MTYEEAIDFVKKYHSCHNVDCDYLGDNAGYCEKCEYNFNVDDFNPAMKIAIECIDKQIPKKPTLIMTRELIGDDLFKTQIVGEFECPSCKRRIMYRRSIIKRCLECGQAIDWS